MAITFCIFDDHLLHFYFTKTSNSADICKGDIENQNNGIVTDSSSVKNKIRGEKISAKWNLMMEIKEKHKSGISLRQLAREYSIGQL
ncbi:MAG TPA: hypothetical protein VK982_14685 [Bacteroidales bacterium]|nr:hypothetical protein [Bacteroidales bacterium]